MRPWSDIFLFLSACRRPVWFVLCQRCATLPTVLTRVRRVHAVLNTSVLSVCVCVCVGPEVVAGKGRRPVETQKAGMVRIGKGGPDQTKIQWVLHVLCGNDW